MRLLHTSDWHVGRSFHGRDLLPDQEAVLGGLAEIVLAEQVDVVLIAGDVYDRALPSAEAVAVCGRILRRIADAGAQLVVIAGNHDSAARLGFGAGFLAAGGLHVHSDPARCGEPLLLRDAHGEVAIYGIPYLEPDTARHTLGRPEVRGHEGVLTAAMEAVRADLAGRSGARSVVLAHAFVVGGECSDSERTIAVGGLETAPAAVFDGVDYVALGHLHGAQQPDAARPWLRYSGSPLAYSFSEVRHTKSAWLIELDDNGLGQVRRLPLPVPRPIATVTGQLAELLADAAFAEFEEHYLAVVLTDRVRPLDALRRLQERFPHAVTLEWQPEGGRPDLTAPIVARGRSDAEVASDFLEYVRQSPPTGHEEELLESAFTAVRQLEAAR